MNARKKVHDFHWTGSILCWFTTFNFTLITMSLELINFKIPHGGTDRKLYKNIQMVENKKKMIENLGIFLKK